MPASTWTSSFEGLRLGTRLLAAANRRSFALACVGSLLAALPAVTLGLGLATGELAPNPLEILQRTLGRWALILLLVVLAATPLRHALAMGARRMGATCGRRLDDWNWMIRLRRPLGIACFLYALAHVVVYLWLDIAFAWNQLAVDLREKPFIWAGLAAFILLLPLALTSTDAWVRRLKGDWKRLHWLVYPTAVLAVLHFVWLTKPGIGDPYGYAIALAVLLGYRVVARWLRSRDPVEALGGEVVRKRQEE